MGRWTANGAAGRLRTLYGVRLAELLPHWGPLPAQEQRTFFDHFRRDQPVQGFLLPSLDWSTLKADPPEMALAIDLDAGNNGRQRPMDGVANRWPTLKAVQSTGSKVCSVATSVC